MWSGAISFGLVNVPVKLYSAVSKKTVRFNQLNAETGNRIQQKRVDPETGEEVGYDQIVKGYELTKDRYVVITPEELDALDPEKTRTVDIEDFVDLEEIDPVYYDHPYYLVPDKGAAKAYALLLGAMKEANKVAIARVVLRSKEQLVAIRPGGDVLMMETMLFHDEVVPSDDIDDLPDAKRAQGLRPRAEDGPAADRLAVERVRPVALPGRVPREGARADREEGRRARRSPSSPRRRSRRACRTSWPRSRRASPRSRTRTAAATAARPSRRKRSSSKTRRTARRAARRRRRRASRDSG